MHIYDPEQTAAAFTVLDMTGHTLNIISLAGLAFAIGMVLDAAIVVLENIVRLRERGEKGERAALMGPTQVWVAERRAIPMRPEPWDREAARRRP